VNTVYPYVIHVLPSILMRCLKDEMVFERPVHGWEYEGSATRLCDSKWGLNHTQDSGIGFWVLFVAMQDQETFIWALTSLSGHAKSMVWWYCNHSVCCKVHKKLPQVSTSCLKKKFCQLFTFSLVCLSRRTSLFVSWLNFV
jgi:hypothetical protein